MKKQSRQPNWTPDEEVWQDEETNQWNPVQRDHAFPLSALKFSDCRRRLKMDCDEKHDATKQGSIDYIAELTEEIRSGGTGVPPISIAQDGTVLDGHHRAAAAKDAGLTHVPVLKPA